jgi:hypothetical protein
MLSTPEQSKAPALPIPMTLTPRVTVISLPMMTATSRMAATISVAAIPTLPERDRATIAVTCRESD